MLYRKYECKNSKSYYEFENNDGHVKITSTSDGVKSEIIVEKIFDTWSESSQYFNKMEQELTRKNLFNDDKLEELRNELCYQEEYEQHICIDLSSLGTIHDNGSRDDKLGEIGKIETDIGIISGGHNVLRYFQWAVMFNTIQKGLLASMDTPEYIKYSEEQPNWKLTANEHDQIEAVIAQVTSAKIKNTETVDDIFLDKKSDIYHNLEVLFLNGQTTYPKELLYTILKTDRRFAKHLDYFENLNLDEIENEIKDEFIRVYSEGVYSDLICFEWYAGDRDKRYAYSYHFEEE